MNDPLLDDYINDNRQIRTTNLSQLEYVVITMQVVSFLYSAWHALPYIFNEESLILLVFFMLSFSGTFITIAGVWGWRQASQRYDQAPAQNHFRAPGWVSLLRKLMVLVVAYSLYQNGKTITFFFTGGTTFYLIIAPIIYLFFSALGTYYLYFTTKLEKQHS